jgi:hypothetical protein
VLFGITVTIGRKKKKMSRIYKYKDMLINLDHISAVDKPYMDGFYKLYKYTIYLNGVAKDFTCKTLDEYNKLIEAWKVEPEINDNSNNQPKKRGGKKY